MAYGSDRRDGGSGAALGTMPGRKWQLTPTSMGRRPASGSRRSTPSCSTTGPSARASCSIACSSTPATPARTTARSHQPYVNTIPPERQEPYPGDLELEHRIRAIIRWNAMATVLQANAESSELGGHIASYQSAATLYEVGFNHFWHAPSETARRRPRLHAGPLVAGHLRPRVPRGPPERGGPARLPPGGLRGRALVVPAPVADAGLLAVPDRLDGPRADHGDLPGALHEVPDRAAG